MMKNTQDIDFEIRFLEGVVKESANFEEALARLGHLYTQKGFYEQGLEIDKRLSRLKPSEAIVFYNLACSYSLLKDIPRAFQAIEQALWLGYDDLNYLLSDTDLENLRKDERFHELIRKAKERNIKKENIS